MPHCLVEGSRALANLIEPAELVRLVHDTAAASDLFKPGEVKVRLSLYEHGCVGGEQKDFIHLIFYVLAGRTDEQKKHLSMLLVRALAQRLASVEAISVDIRDIDRAAFSNKRSLENA
ncbi:MAG TPA: 5-carboxymethyl-2-hydroxymuconate isomerase [Pseudomonas sp.]|nr:5-carboxymethyl-2-hydroxymuconate isomerase [Pseudomonas sp.]